MVGGTCYLRKIDQTWNDGRIDIIPFIAQMVIQVTENAPCGPIHIYKDEETHEDMDFLWWKKVEFC